MMKKSIKDYALYNKPCTQILGIFSPLVGALLKAVLLHPGWPTDLTLLPVRQSPYCLP